MKTNSDTSGRSGVRGLMIGLTLLILVGLIVAGIWRSRSRTTASDVASAAATATEPTEEPVSPVATTNPAPNQDESAAVPPVDPVVPSRRATPAQTAASAPSRPEHAPGTRELVQSLVRAGAGNTPEDAAAWKQTLGQLVQQGAGGVPAIREFLEKNADQDFKGAAGQALGYPSARAAMFDALAHIGGPEATQTLADTLRGTADPREIGLLGRHLETLAPEQYRAEAFHAARQTLEMASQGKLPQTDVAPIFETFLHLGNESVIPDLEAAAGRWKYYSTMALAQLPDGAGIPSLIRMAQNPDPSGSETKSAALQMLTSVSSQYPDARSTLVNMARNNQIAPNLWPYLSGVLEGDQFRFGESVYGGAADTLEMENRKSMHLAGSNQRVSHGVPQGGLNPAQVQYQVGLIDELLAANSNPGAAQWLQMSRANLLRRYPVAR